MLKRLRAAAAAVAVAALWLLAPAAPQSAEAQRPTLYWGTSGSDVRAVQQRLAQWGYFQGGITGYYGAETYQAVRLFQRRNGLAVDGVVGPATWRALGLWTGAAAAAQPAAAVASPVAVRTDEVDLLARLIAAEAQGEPYEGQVAVGAVILNRVRSPQFPNTLGGVAYQPLAFESVVNGLVWRRVPNTTAYQAARDALNGWDPSYGSLFFWNPYKPVSSWIWTRPIVRQIGNHVFAR